MNKKEILESLLATTQMSIENQLELNKIKNKISALEDLLHYEKPKLFELYAEHLQRYQKESAPFDAEIVRPRLDELIRRLKDALTANDLE